jgi:DNA-binding GntR family transcriptional regulator
MSQELRFAKEIVFKKLRDGIISGHYKPGQRLVERELAEMMNVSRTPVREALGRLEQEKLVTTTSSNRVIVIEPNLNDVREIFQCRIVLEALVARLAAQNATTAQIEFLEKNVEEACITKGTEKLVLYNSDFHNMICKASHNQRLFDLLIGLQTQISLLRTTSLSVEGRPQANIDEHRDIFKAVKNRRPEVAEVMMKNHLEMVSESIYNIFTRNKKGYPL